jgi:hypothetical protein
MPSVEAVVGKVVLEPSMRAEVALTVVCVQSTGLRAPEPGKV